MAVIGKQFWEQLGSNRQNTSPPSYATDTYWAFIMGQAFFFALGDTAVKKPLPLLMELTF